MSFLTKMYSIKCKRGVSDVGSNDYFELVHDAFDFAEVPPTFYSAKKTVMKMGLNYIKIDACRNDCMLFRDDDADLERCRRCNEFQYKEMKQGRWAKKRAAKRMWYFPLGPRLQRLYMSP